MMRLPFQIGHIFCPPLSPGLADDDIVQASGCCFQEYPTKAKNVLLSSFIKLFFINYDVSYAF